MKKSEIFTKVLGIVSVETEIPTDAILSDSKSSEVVDATQAGEVRLPPTCLVSDYFL